MVLWIKQQIWNSSLNHISIPYISAKNQIQRIPVDESFFLKSNSSIVPLNRHFYKHSAARYASIPTVFWVR